jgi:hypothetical protein
VETKGFHNDSIEENQPANQRTNIDRFQLLPRTNGYFAKNRLPNTHIHASGNL